MEESRWAIHRAAIVVGLLWLSNEVAFSQTVVTEHLRLDGTSDAVFFPPGPSLPYTAGIFSFTATFCHANNTGPLYGLESRTRTLTNQNVLLDFVGTSLGGVGSVLPFPLQGDYADQQLSADECTDIQYQIGMETRDPFVFNVDIVSNPVVRGQPVGLVVNSIDSLTIRDGNPSSCKLSLDVTLTGGSTGVLPAAAAGNLLCDALEEGALTNHVPFRANGFINLFRNPLTMVIVDITRP